MKKQIEQRRVLIAAGGAVLVLAILFGGYGYWLLNKINSSLEGSLVIIKQELNQVRQENINLSEALVNEQNKNKLFEAQINNILNVVGDLSGTVGVLQKLSRTDPELLKKYSKVYFLNENYVPSLLSIIDEKYIYDKNKPQQIQVNIAPFLADILEAAERDGINLRVVSAYRSFGTQAGVKSGYVVTYGAGTANQFSADQGYSEHQLGSAIDFTSTETDEIFNGFEDTEAYRWLLDNAFKFGFVLSYPQDNSYYQFEPWHWRFTGRKLATDLHNEGKYFYELPQREIDEYLVSLFD